MYIQMHEHIIVYTYVRRRMRASPPPSPGGPPGPLMSVSALCAPTDNVSPAGAHLQPPMLSRHLVSLTGCQKVNILYSRFGPQGKTGTRLWLRLPCPALPPAVSSSFRVSDAGTRLWLRPHRHAPLPSPLRCGWAGKRGSRRVLEPNQIGDISVVTLIRTDTTLDHSQTLISWRHVSSHTDKNKHYT